MGALITLCKNLQIYGYANLIIRFISIKKKSLLCINYRAINLWEGWERHVSYPKLQHRRDEVETKLADANGYYSSYHSSRIVLVVEI